MNLDLLEKSGDDELRVTIARCEELLEQRDRQRKEKALEQARATLAAVGLTLKDLNGKGKPKGPIYHGGHQYQHPTDKTLMWKGKGQKPNWVRELEASGGKAVELP